MREPRPIGGLPLPLFDRLCQVPAESGRGPFADRVLDSAALHESVRRDLSRLLNTRSSLRGSLEQLAAGTVLDYGLPDFSPLTPASDGDRNILAKELAARIAAHEPRLRNVRVVIAADAVNPRAVQGVIMASLAMGEVYEPVTFYMAMDLRGNSLAATLT